MEGTDSGFRERMLLSIRMEEACASAYKALAELFSWNMRVRELWDTLAFEERMHAVSILSLGIEDSSGCPPDDLLCESLPEIKKAISLAAGLREKAVSGSLTLADSLRLALELEEKIAESYLFDVMKKDLDLRHLEKIKEIVSFEKTHSETLREFMRGRGMEI